MVDDPKPEEPAQRAFDFETYKKEVLSNPKAREVIDFFLLHRHREWEENLTNKLDIPAKDKSSS